MFNSDLDKKNSKWSDSEVMSFYLFHENGQL